MLYAKLAWGNMKKSGRDYAVYFVTLIISVALIYAFNSLPDQQAVLKLNELGSELMKHVQQIMSGVSVFIAVFLSFLILYVDRFILRRRKKEMGLYLLLGMTRMSIIKMRGLESIFVLLISLVVGIGVGVVFSYALLQVTSLIFRAPIKGFGFFISSNALSITCLIFCAIFLLSLFWSSGSIVKSKLIRLFRAQSEVSTRGILPLVVAIPVWFASIACIAFSYYLLSQSGINPTDSRFLMATALVILGTFSFFWSLSGVLLKFVQLIKPLYFCGLNMFTVRQFASRFSSSHIMVSAVSLCLFLAITGISTGTSIALGVTKSVENSARMRVDASSQVINFGAASEDAPESQSLEAPNLNQIYQDAADREHMDLGKVIAQSVQVNSYILPDAQLSGLDTIGEAEQPVPTNLVFIRESEINKLRKLTQQEPISLGDSEYQVLSSSEMINKLLDKLMAESPILSINGKELTSQPKLLDTSLSLLGSSFTDICIVVPDTYVSDQTIFNSAYFNVNFVNDNEESAKNFDTLSKAAADIVLSNYEKQGSTAIATMNVSKMEILQMAYGLSGIVAYMAIYIGATLIMSAAAMLAIQQLSSVSDSLLRYRCLSNLGARGSQIKLSLFLQVLVYFLFPLGLALCHSLMASHEVVKIVSNFGRLDIASLVSVVITGFAVIYGLYMLVSYLGSCSLLRERPVRN